MKSDDRVTSSRSIEYRVKLKGVSCAPTWAPPQMRGASGYNEEKSCLLRPSSITEAGTKIEEGNWLYLG